MTYTTMPEDIRNALPKVWKDGSYSWFYLNFSLYTYIYV